LLLSRRKVLVSGVATLILGGCERLATSPTFQQMLMGAEGLTYRSQRTLIGRQTLAREYTPADISVRFKANGSQDPYNLPPGYLDMAQDGYAGWRLQVGGLVMNPMSSRSPISARSMQNANHPSRLRRRVERHRQLDRPAAFGRARSCGLASRSALHRVPLRR
jgi:hypothetical protein